MVTDTGKIRQTVKERRRTYYKLHPNQEKYPGAVITMPNLPDDEHHWSVWQAKGYKPSPQELMPDKKLVQLIDSETKKPSEWRFEISPSEAPPAFECDVCGQKCASPLGLQSHKRSHKDEIK